MPHALNAAVKSNYSLMTLPLLKRCDQQGRRAQWALGLLLLLLLLLLLPLLLLAG
jgi:hypothetical protein